MNAKENIERLFELQTRGSKAATGGLLKDLALPKISLVIGESYEANHQLTFPLVDPQSVSLVKEHGSAAKVGMNGREIMNLNMRKSHQLLPHQICIDGLTNQPAFSSLLSRIQDDLCLRNTPGAHFHKFLLYEVGSFFKKHRDHERLPNTIGTLTIELPSKYTGGALRVWLPDNPEPTSFHSGSTSELGFSAFFADCPHEVTELTEGNRCVLVFTLTITEMLESPPTVVFAPSEYATALVKHLQQWSSEDRSVYTGEQDKGKPEKLAIILHHSYTREGITGGGATWISMSALKGKDREIVELVVAAARQSSDFDAYVSFLNPSNELAPLETQPYPALQFLQSRALPDETGIFSWVTGAKQMPIYSGEIVTTSSEEMIRESSGNYNRAALLLWPKSQRAAVASEIIRNYWRAYEPESDDEIVEDGHDPPSNWTGNDGGDY